jgi:hypothetical protein
MNKTVASIIISLLLAITGCIAYFVFVWSRPSKKSGSTTTTTTTGAGTTTGSAGTSTPSSSPASPAPGEAVSSSPESDPNLITVSIKKDAGEGFNIYNFDTDPNHFNSGDSIFAMEQITILDENEDTIDVQQMEMIGTFKSRDLSGIYIDNSTTEQTYKVPGINQDRKIAKLINT